MSDNALTILEDAILHKKGLTTINAHFIKQAINKAIDDYCSIINPQSEVLDADILRLQAMVENLDYRIENNLLSHNGSFEVDATKLKGNILRILIEREKNDER